MHDDRLLLDRRQLLARAAVGATVVAASPLLARAAGPKGKSRSKIRDIYRGVRGTTIWMDLEAAPFPYAGTPYSNPTVIAFVPHHFRVRKDMRADVVMHFHGWRDTADAAMKRHQLREQLYESRQNAILIVPQGPVRTEDSSGGKLDRPGGLLALLTEARKTLQLSRVGAALGPAGLPKAARIGKLILSAHSGGYKVLANCLDHGRYNVNEVYLFDALYGRVDAFRKWVLSAPAEPMDKRHKLVSYYSGKTPRAANARLMKGLKRNKVPFLVEQTEGELTRAQITKARAVFIETNTGHQSTLHRYNNLRDCLYASCLTRYLKSGWFEASDKPRQLERRVTKPKRKM